MRSHYGDGYSNADMERGHIEEPAARALYEAETFYAVQNGGFFCDDYIGCSPDGLVGEDGGIEIKSVLPQTHAATKRRGNFDPAYGWQILGNLTHTGREWWDFVSYCSFAPEPYQLLVYRIHREQYRTQIQQLLAREQRFRHELAALPEYGLCRGNRQLRSLLSIRAPLLAFRPKQRSLCAYHRQRSRRQRGSQHQTKRTGCTSNGG